MKAANDWNESRWAKCFQHAHQPALYNNSQFKRFSMRAEKHLKASLVMSRFDWKFN